MFDSILQYCLCLLMSAYISLCQLQISVVSESLFSRVHPSIDVEDIAVEITQYRSVESSGVATIIFNKSSMEWEIERSTRTSGGCGDITHPQIRHFSYITALLGAYWDVADDEDRNLLSRMTLNTADGGLIISLVGGIAVVPPPASGIKTFYVYATNRYGSRLGSKLRYDCVQTDAGFAQVLAILRITDLHHIDEDGDSEVIDHFLLVVTHLIAADKSASDKYLPYPLLKYNAVHDPGLGRNVLQMEIIDAESISRPAILIPCPDRSSNFGLPYKDVPRGRRRNPPSDCTANIRMWGIPYKTIDRSNYLETVAEDDAEEVINPDLHLDDAIIENIYDVGNDLLMDDDDNISIT